MGRKGFSHERAYKGQTNDWLTPKYIIDDLGPFDFDPCAAPLPRPWKTAKRMSSLPVDGLAVTWEGFVWCNPPYGEKIGAWIDRMVEHGNGIMLIFARTETKAFRRVWENAYAVLFISGRVRFCRTDGSMADAAAAPSCLAAFGRKGLAALQRSQIPGALVTAVSMIGG